ncbi:DUF5668 domain-containing protein [Cupriavidus sp. 2TAF22]|uniref:LiaI-LiaF-like domain-containing protein n=1 Tax=unclassified Cupriavidus TaxID=2640874 RepID=UPI003F936156
MKQGRSGRGLLAPIILIALGGLFLAHNAGVLPAYITREGWPLILIALGAVLLVRRLAIRRATQRGPRP